LWKPFPNKPQETAYNSQADEILYGGAAGAGKSALAVGLAITKHKRSLILRRVAVECVELVDQIKRFCGTAGQWRGSGHGGTMTVHGRVIEIAGCEHESDKVKFQGRPHSLICFDEATSFTQSQFRFISAWNRDENPDQQCQILLGTNPPTTPEARWIVEEFAPWVDDEFTNPAAPGELRWFTFLDGKLTWVDGPEPFDHTDERTGKVERIKPRSRTFIPGFLSDNPILSATDYGAKLQALPEPLRSQLMYGDWNAGNEDDAYQVIPTAWVRAAFKRWTPQPPNTPMTAMGVDVARGGSNKTVISRRHDRWFAPLIKIEGRDTPDGRAAATRVLKVHEDDATINIDVIGVGASANDILKEQAWLDVQPINNAGATKLRDKSGKLKFVNVRAASYWQLREALDPDGEDPIALCPDNELLADLCAPRYELQTSGIKIEKKEDIVERIGRSPDCGDSVVLCNWEPNSRPRPMQIHGFRLHGGKKKPRAIHILICAISQLENVVIEEPAVLIVLTDPTAEPPVMPPHGLQKMVAAAVLAFLDEDPADFRPTWDEPIQPHGKPIRELVMDKPAAARLWKAVLTRTGTCEDSSVFVIADNGGNDRRAISTAYAISDQLRLPRNRVVYRVGDPDDAKHEGKEPPNKHAYQIARSGRHLLM
jgi:hypothetical protein